MVFLCAFRIRRNKKYFFIYTSYLGFMRKVVVVLALVSVIVLGGTPLYGLDVYTMKEEIRVDEGESIMQDTYDLVIIAPSEFIEDLKPFVGHKNVHGVPTILVSLDEIYSSRYFPVQGRDCAEEIKYFIKNAYDVWGIHYVLLVGGRHGGFLKEKWWMPVRYSYVGTSSDWETGYLSDLYFADIYDAQGDFSSWDTDGNGIFGEWIETAAEDAPIDMKPDVFVGRWPARNSFEVEVMVSKTMYYENNTYGRDWFDDMVCIAGDTYPDDLNPEWVGYEGEEGTQRAIDWMPGFNPITLWTSDGTFTGKDDVIQAINQGCGFLFFDGHGNPMNWATHPPSDHETWIDGLGVRDMPQLTNDNMYPVCVVGGCHNSQFNVSVLNALKIWEGSHWYEYLYKGETAYECWSWRLTCKNGGGAIATLGYSALGYTKEDKQFTGEASEWLDTHFFWEYGINHTDILGEVWGKVITAYLDTYPIDWNSHVESPTAIDAKTAQEWILMGDPSLKIGGYPS
jgi:hypothetical protein